jgi:hypothetical protein
MGFPWLGFVDWGFVVWDLVMGFCLGCCCVDQSAGDRGGIFFCACLFASVIY